MVKKTEEKKKFPKTRPMGRGLLGNIVDAATDVAAEVAKAEGVPASVADAVNESVDKVVMPKRDVPIVGEVTGPVKKFVKIEQNSDNKIHIDIQGFNPFEALVIIKNAHKYLFDQVKKEVDKLNVGEEGATDSVSGGNS